MSTTPSHGMRDAASPPNMRVWPGLRTGLPWLVTVAACAAPAFLALAHARPSGVAMCVALAFVPYAWLLASSRELDEASARRLAWLGAALSGVVLWLAPPVLSDDVYRYVWDGRVLSRGIDPYAYAPDHPKLAQLRDGLWTHINHRDIATIYPPIAQLLFALGDLVVHTPLAPKGIALAAHLVATSVVARLGARHGRPHAALVLGLNPLALSESALHGHVDAVAGAALAAAVLALELGRPVRAALALALATGTKLVGLLLLPFTARLRGRGLLLASIASVVVLAPLALHAGDERSGVGQYARRWRGNDAAFSLIERGVTHVLTTQAMAEERGRNHIRLVALAPVLDALAGTALDPWRGVVAQGKAVPDRADFEIPFLAGLLTRALVLVATLALPWLLLSAGVSPLMGARVTLFSALLLAPQIHPWYLLWLLPLEAATGAWAGVAWSATVLVAYAPLDLWQRARIWNEWRLANLCEFIVVGLVLLGDAWVIKRTRLQHVGLPAMSNRPRGE